MRLLLCCSSRNKIEWINDVSYASYLFNQYVLCTNHRGSIGLRARHRSYEKKIEKSFCLVKFRFSHQHNESFLKLYFPWSNPQVGLRQKYKYTASVHEPLWICVLFLPGGTVHPWSDSIFCIPTIYHEHLYYIFFLFSSKL